MFILFIIIRGDYFRLCLVFIQKNNQIKIFFKKTETGSNRPVSVWFGFLGQKSVWLGFFGLAWFFPVFFSLGSVRFF